MPSLIFDKEEIARLDAVVEKEEAARQECVDKIRNMVDSGEAWDSSKDDEHARLAAKERLHANEAERVQKHIDRMKANRVKTEKEVKANIEKPFERWVRKGPDELTPEERNEQKDRIATFGNSGKGVEDQFVMPFEASAVKPGTIMDRSDWHEYIKDPDRAFAMDSSLNFPASPKDSPQNAAISPQTAGLSATIVQPVDQDYFHSMAAYGGALDVFSTIFTPDGVKRQFLVYPTDTASATGPTATWSTAQVENAISEDFKKIDLDVQMYTTGFVDINRYAFEDVGFNVAMWANAVMYRRLGKKLESQAFGGTGAADNPRGFFTAATERANTATGQGKFRWTDAIDIEHAIPYPYLFGAEEGLYGYTHSVGKTCYVTSWQFMAVLKKLVDSEGRPLFLPGYHSRTIFDLNGWPIHICHEFTDTAEGNNKKPIVFGNFAHMVQRYAGAGFMIEKHYDSATALSNFERWLGRLRWGCGIVGPFDGTENSVNMKAKGLRVMKLTT